MRFETSTVKIEKMLRKKIVFHCFVFKAQVLKIKKSFWILTEQVFLMHFDCQNDVRNGEFCDKLRESQTSNSSVNRIFIWG